MKNDGNHIVKLSQCPFNYARLYISVFFSKLFSGKLSKPLYLITEKIERIKQGKNHEKPIFQNGNSIIELSNFESFISGTVNELHNANAVKSDFLMNMSHDFRTPASGIYQMSEIIYKKISDPDLKKLQKLVMDSSCRLLRLLEEVLDYSRFDTGCFKIKKEHFDLKDLIHDVYNFLQPEIERKNLLFKINIYIPALCFNDVTLTRRVLLNIIVNAIKYTEKGSITINITKDEIKPLFWKISIQDTGIGISAEDYEKIFDSFVRLDTTELISKNTGLGLGLSNVKRMMALLGGSILVESVIGVGTTFHVLFPGMEK